MGQRLCSGDRSRTDFASSCGDLLPRAQATSPWSQITSPSLNQSLFSDKDRDVSSSTGLFNNREGIAVPPHGATRLQRKTKSYSELTKVQITGTNAIGVQEPVVNGETYDKITYKYGHETHIRTKDQGEADVQSRRPTTLPAQHVWQLCNVNSEEIHSTLKHVNNTPCYTQHPEISWRKSNRHVQSQSNHPIIASHSLGVTAASFNPHSSLSRNIPEKRLHLNRLTGLEILRKKNIITSKLVTCSNEANCSLFLGNRGNLSSLHESDTTILERTTQVESNIWSYDDDDDVKGNRSLMELHEPSGDGIDRVVEVTRRWLTDIFSGFNEHIFDYIQKSDLITAGLSLALGRCENKQATSRCLIDFMTDGQMRNVQLSDDISLSESIPTNSLPKERNKVTVKSHWQVSCLNSTKEETAPEFSKTLYSTNASVSSDVQNRHDGSQQLPSFKIVRNFLALLTNKNRILKPDVCKKLILWLDAADSVIELAESVRAMNSQFEVRKKCDDVTNSCCQGFSQNSKDVNVSTKINFNDNDGETMRRYFFAEIVFPPQQNIFNQSFDQISSRSIIDFLNGSVNSRRPSGDNANHSHVNTRKNRNSIGFMGESLSSSPFVSENGFSLPYRRSSNRRAWSLNKYSFDETDSETLRTEFISTKELMPSFSVMLSHCSEDTTLDHLTQTVAGHSCITHVSIVRGGDLNAHQINDICLALERKEHGLVQLDLRMNQLMQLDVIERLSTGLQNASCLRQLNLSSTGLTGAGASLLLRAIAKGCALQALEDLDLGYNELGDEQCVNLSECLLDGRHGYVMVKKLRLKNNGITKVGAERLATALKRNSRLTLLDLSSNALGNDGLRHIFESLLLNRTLAKLLLNDCNLTAEGCGHIARILAANMSLRTLSINTNAIGDRGVACLSEGLKYNRTLEVLCLNMCCISNTGFRRLLADIAGCYSLRTIKLCYNFIGSPDVSKLSYRRWSSVSTAVVDPPTANINNNNNTAPSSIHQPQVFDLYADLCDVLSQNPDLKIYLWGNNLDVTSSASLAGGTKGGATSPPPCNGASPIKQAYNPKEPVFGSLPNRSGLHRLRKGMTDSGYGTN